jgi:hypothetical protein
VTVILVVLALMWWSFWRYSRTPRPSRVAAVATGKHRHPGHETAARGLEDDPDRWRVAGCAWTALDDLQLTRLLRESASVTGAATNPPEGIVPCVEVEDIP